MTDTFQSKIKETASIYSRQPRRPGWGLIHDVRLRPTPRSVTLKQPEGQQQARAKPVLRTSLPNPAIIPSHKLTATQWARRHTLAIYAPVIMVVSMLLSSVPIIGEILIIAFGVYALLKRVPSRTSFWLATILLAGIGLEFLLLPQFGHVDNSALFVFLLLIIGFLSASLETRRMQRQEKAVRVDNTTTKLSVKTRG